MNCQLIKDILRYHKTAMPYARRQKTTTGFRIFSFKVCYTTNLSGVPLSATVLQVIHRHLCCEGKPLILPPYYSGPARLSKRRGVNYDEWLGRKVAAEQRIIDAKKAEIERKRVEEEER